MAIQEREIENYWVSFTETQVMYIKIYSGKNKCNNLIEFSSEKITQENILIIILYLKTFQTDKNFQKQNMKIENKHGADIFLYFFKHGK